MLNSDRQNMTESIRWVHTEISSKRLLRLVKWRERPNEQSKTNIKIDHLQRKRFVSILRKMKNLHMQNTAFEQPNRTAFLK